MAGNPTDFLSIQTLASQFISTVLGGYTTINPIANRLFAAIITITIVVTAIMSYVWGDFETVIRDLIKKVLVIGFIAFLMQKWLVLTGGIGYGFTQIGMSVGGIPGSAQTFLQDPTNIFLIGWHVVQGMQNSILPITSGWLRVLSNLPIILIYEVAMVFTMIGFAILGIQLFVTFIEFLIINLAALVFVPFSIFGPTKFLSERSFSFVFSAGAKLFVISLIIGISHNFLQNITVSATPNVANATAIAISSLFTAALAITIPKLAASLVAGSPNLGAGDLGFAGAAAAGGLAAGAYYGARGVGALSGGAIQGISGASGALSRYRAAAAGGSPSGGLGGGGLGGAAGASSLGPSPRPGGGAGGATGTNPALGARGSRAAWMMKSGGLNALSGSDRQAALSSFDRWQSGNGAGLPYGADSYVEYVQRAAAAEGRGVAVDAMEP